MTEDDISYLGPFIYTQGRMFYRGIDETLWELRPTGDRYTPIEFTKIAGFVDSIEPSYILYLIKNMEPS